MARCHRSFLQRDPSMRQFSHAKGQPREVFRPGSRVIVRDRVFFFWDREREHGQKLWLQLCRSIVGKQLIRPARRMDGSKLLGRCCIGASGRSTAPCADQGWQDVDALFRDPYSGVIIHGLMTLTENHKARMTNDEIMTHSKPLNWS